VYFCVRLSLAEMLKPRLLHLSVRAEVQAQLVLIDVLWDATDEYLP
jgi:hypothetical protein